MREIALHLLDIAENSVAAGASSVTIEVCEDLEHDRLTAAVQDDGRGMDPELLARVTDPFVTSRTTRKVGLGIPLLKAAAEACRGGLTIHSSPAEGTRLEVSFQHNHIDRMPLGNLAATLLTLVVAYPDIHWLLRYSVRHPGGHPPAGAASAYTFDDRPVKAALDGLPLCEPEVLGFLREYLEQGIRRVQDALPAGSPFTNTSNPLG